MWVHLPLCSSWQTGGEALGSPKTIGSQSLTATQATTDHGPQSKRTTHLINMLLTGLSGAPRGHVRVRRVQQTAFLRVMVVRVCVCVLASTNLLVGFVKPVVFFCKFGLLLSRLHVLFPCCTAQAVSRRRDQQGAGAANRAAVRFPPPRRALTRVKGGKKRAATGSTSFHCAP